MLKDGLAGDFDHRLVRLRYLPDDAAAGARGQDQRLLDQLKIRNRVQGAVRCMRGRACSTAC